MRTRSRVSSSRGERDGTAAARTLARIRELDARVQEQREYRFAVRGQMSDEEIESRRA